MKRFPIPFCQLLLLLLIGVFLSPIAFSQNKRGGHASIIGWFGDLHSPIVYPNGRIKIWGPWNAAPGHGKDHRGMQQPLGGKMHGFGIYSALKEDSVRWYLEDNYLPHSIVEFRRNEALVRISHFADRVVIDGNPFVAVYSRVSVINEGDAPVDLPPLPSKDFIPLTNNPATVQPGQTVHHDYVLPADRFWAQYDWPSTEALRTLQTWDDAHAHMKSFWDDLLARGPQFTAFPNSDAQWIYDKLRASYIHNWITMDARPEGDRWDFCSGQDTYDTPVSHDLFEIIYTQMLMGYLPEDQVEIDHMLDPISKTGEPTSRGYNDYHYVKFLFLAHYLMLTDDKASLEKRYPDLKENIHQLMTYRGGREGTMGESRTVDKVGFWTCDTYAMLSGLSGYRFISQKLGHEEEAQWALEAYDDLLESLNRAIVSASKEGGLTERIPVHLSEPEILMEPKGWSTGWAANGLFGRWPWHHRLFPEPAHGPAIEKFESHFDKCLTIVEEKLGRMVPGECAGWNGYNGGQINPMLAVTNPTIREDFRDYPMLHNIWSAKLNQYGPMAYAELNTELVDGHVWQGKHPDDRAGAVPQVWGQSVAAVTILHAILAQHSDGHVIIGRGLPTEWLQPGMSFAVENMPIGNRQKLGYSITNRGEDLEIVFQGEVPEPGASIELPVFSRSLEAAEGGRIDAENYRVLVAPGTDRVLVKCHVPEKGQSIPDPEEEPLVDSTPEPGVLILDDGEPGFTSSIGYNVQQAKAGAVGMDITISSKASEQMKQQPQWLGGEVPEEGYWAKYDPSIYQLNGPYEIWVHTAVERGTPGMAPFTVFHQDGETEKSFKMHKEGDWELHGTYSLDENSLIVVAGKTEEQITLDAVKFVKVQGPEETAP